MTKSNCHECKHRRSIPGNTHISCHNPSFDSIWENPLSELLSMMGAPSSFKSSSIRVIGNPVGIRGGWFSHPFNFDPTWLIECTGFEQQ